METIIYASNLFKALFTKWKQQNHEFFLWELSLILRALNAESESESSRSKQKS